MPSLLDRIRNVFTNQMYTSAEAHGWVEAAVEDARTYMAQGLITATQEPGAYSYFEKLAVGLGANQEKLGNSLGEYHANDWIHIDGAEDREQEEYEGSVALPEELGLSPDQATLLCCISNIPGDVTGERLYMEMRAAGIGSHGDMGRLHSDLKALRESGLITDRALNGYRSAVDLTDDGRSIAQDDISFRKQDLLADLADRKTELNEEFERVSSWSDDGGKMVPLSPAGLAEYLEAISVIDQMELSISTGAPLQMTGEIPKDSAANQVIEDFRQRLAQVGGKIERVQEVAQANGQEQENGQVMAAGRGMAMRA